MMRKSIPFPRCFRIGALCLLACATSCKGTTLFKDHFEADAVGSPPALSPPGSPTGDEIYIATSTAAHKPQVVNDSVLGSKALKYVNVDTNVPFRYVGFLSKSSDIGPTKKIRATWNGRIDLASGGSGLDVWLGDSHFAAIASLRFKGGDIQLQTSGGASPTYETIGSYVENATHSATITVDKALGQYSVVIMPLGIASGWRPVLSQPAMGAARPTLYLLFFEPVNSSGFYAVDDVLIRRLD